MTPNAVIERICCLFPEIKAVDNWGETSLFYNRDQLLPKGVLLATIKEADTSNDGFSKLNRAGIYRLTISLTPMMYKKMFGQKPPLHLKGESLGSTYNFEQINHIMPHPIYAWRSWAQVLSPTATVLEQIFIHLEELYKVTVLKFNHKLTAIERRKHKRSQRDKKKDRVKFSCKNIEEIIEVSNLYKHSSSQSQKVYDFLETSYKTHVLVHFTRLDIYQMIKTHLGYSIPQVVNYSYNINK